MALDPSTPDDLKQRLQRGLSSFLPNQLQAYGQSNNAQAPDPAAVPKTAFADVQAGATPNVPKPGQGLTPGSTLGLPDGVHAANAGGIYEGRRGLAGERVFSDNAYDPLLTDRSSPGVGLHRLEPAATAALANTPGATDSRGYREEFNPALAPTSAPHYRFAGGTDAGIAQREAGLRLNPSAAGALNETPAQVAARIGSNDPNAIGSEIAANKAALADTRYTRGEGVDSATGLRPLGAPGAPGVGGFPAGTTLRDIIDFQKTGADVRHTGFQDSLEADKTANDRGQKVYDQYAETAKTLSPGQRYGLSSEQFANIQASGHAEATPAIKANADSAVNNVVAQAFNQSRVPGVGRDPISPQDVGKFDIEPFRQGKAGAGLRYATDLNGKALSLDEAHALEAANKPFKWVTTNFDSLGPAGNVVGGGSGAASLLADPNVGSALLQRLSERSAARRKPQQGLRRE